MATDNRRRADILKMKRRNAGKASSRYSIAGGAKSIKKIYRMSSHRENEHWDLIIKPQGNFLDLNLKDIWRYRDLLIQFIKRDFVAQYKQTVLGLLWNVIQPILTTIMFLLVFGKIANIPTDGIKAPLFYLSGITIWNYFATCFTSISTTFVTNATIFGKVYFPRLVLPFSVVFSNIIRFFIQFGFPAIVRDGLLCFQGLSHPYFISVAADPFPGDPDGRYRAGLRDHHFLTFHDQVQGFYRVGCIQCAIIDV